ncbi:MAG TPA: O-antigen ligase family protein [Burkholderiales bacterium]|nr:O-antigen ligase family protein [Burkholderiales bacterium]
MTLSEFQKYSADVARACALGLAVSLPFSTALDNVLLVFLLAGWLAAGDWRRRWTMLRANPVALTALGFVALLAAGLAYGERPLADGWRYFGKYADLLLVAMLIMLFADARWRQRAWSALAAGLLLLLALSCLTAGGLVPPNPWLHGTPGNPVVFKQWLTHGILMAFGAFVFALRALYSATPAQRAGWFAAAALAATNVLFMVQGRTGYLVLALLALYFGYVWRRRAGLAALAAGLVIIVSGGFVLSSTLHDRAMLALHEAQQWRPGAATHTSVGLRLEFYRNSLAIIRERPLVGAGTGGFPYAYRQQIAGSAQEPTDNPHNEYLHMTAQLGVAGLAALLTLFWMPWRCAAWLPTAHETHLARGLVLAIAAGCLFNSLLIDHTERLLFAWGLGVLFASLQSRALSSGQP